MGNKQWLILLLLVLSLGCTQKVDQVAIERLLEGGEQGFQLHYFHEDADMAPVPDGQVHMLWWSEDDDLSGVNESVHTHMHYVGTGDHKEWVKGLGLTKFPVFVLTDHEKILLITDDMKKIGQFISRENHTES
ncbi:hypothetical protein [Peribacillus sp. NPDC056705]|uniref:hypothetical protein n=1 Tax=Peribacillus sp. NPDC056705 TaxID=3345918 RepID=UPI00374A08B2